MEVVDWIDDAGEPESNDENDTGMIMELMTIVKTTAIK